jgi:hypothetical protein
VRNSPDEIALQARVLDLERKIDTLQALVQGNVHQPYDEQALQALYWDACRRFGRLKPREAFLWSCCIRNLDVTQLLTLGRLVHDPFPWKPFLVLLDWATEEGHLVEEATEHLERIAQDLLYAQGLWLLSPCDLMASPLEVQKALRSY